MATTIAQMKTRVTGRYDDAVNTKFSDTYFIDRINDFEQDMYSRIITKYVQATDDTVADTQTYSLPSGTDFNDIATYIYIDAVPYLKVSGEFDHENPDYNTFWWDGSKIAVYPIPTTSGTDNITIPYSYAPTAHSTTSGTLRLPDQFLIAYEYYIMMIIYRVDLNVPERRESFTDLYNMEEMKIKEWWSTLAPVNVSNQVIDCYGSSTIC